MDKTFIIKANLDQVRQVAKQKGYTPIQAEILAQLYALNPLWRHLYNVEAILNIKDGYGVRLHTRHSDATVNIDIIYNPVPDLYTVEAYTIANHIDTVKTYQAKDVYFDQLLTTIQEALKQSLR